MYHILDLLDDYIRIEGIEIDGSNVTSYVSITQATPGSAVPGTDVVGCLPTSGHEVPAYDKIAVVNRQGPDRVVDPGAKRVPGTPIPTRHAAGRNASGGREHASGD